MPAKYYERIDGKPGRSRIILSAIFAIFLIAMAVLGVGAYVAFTREGARSKETVAVYNVDVDDNGELTGVGERNYTLLMEIAITDVNPVQQTLRINTKLLRVAGSQTVNGSLLLGSFKSVPFGASSAFIDQDVTVLADGDLQSYPFDRYVAQMPFAATQGDVLLSPNTTSLVWGAYAFPSGLSGYRLEMEFAPDPDVPINYLNVSVKRAPTTIGFSMFIAAIMWLLAIAAVVISFQAVFRGRDVPAPLLGVNAALLFALPAIRNTMPLAGPIGNVTDTLSLFFCMALVAVSAIVLMFAYISQGPTPKPMAKP